jgi:release factor glutamine methyltransferase
VKVSAALLQAERDLSSKGVSNSKLDSLILLSHALFFSKERIIFNPDLKLNLSQQKAFFDIVQRRIEREPISHIIGKREFFGEEFFVSSNVLDPRPDSETLIELVLKNFSRKNQKLKILELGVGSGCLIITLLKTYKIAEGIGVDLSKKALEVCHKNASIHQIQDRLKLLESNLFQALSAKEKFDLIISNPPYIPSEEIKYLEPEVRIYEPRLALDGGKDGLDFYREIASQAGNFLNKEGQIILEIGYGQQQQIVGIFTENRFSLTESSLDLSGIVRALCFKKD